MRGGQPCATIGQGAGLQDDAGMTSQLVEVEVRVAGQRNPTFGHAFTSCSLCLCLQVYLSSVSECHLYSD